MSRPPAAASEGDPFRGSFSNLSVSHQAAIQSPSAPATVPSSSFVPSNLSLDDPHYLLRLSIGLFVEGVDVLYRDMADPLPATTPITSASLGRAAEILSHTLTKYLLLLSRSSAADRPLVLKETEHLSHAITNLCCMLRSILSPPCGSTLSTATVTVGRSLLSALRQSVLSLQATVIEGGEVNVQRAGQVWEVCQAVEKAPVSDKDAVGREVAGVLRMIKDAKQEVSQMRVTEVTSEEGRSRTAATDDDDDFEDDNDDEMTAEEYALVPVTTDFISFAFSVTRLVYSLILKAPPSTHHTQWMEEQLTVLRSVSSTIDSLVHALYPPQSSTTLSTTFSSLSSQLCGVLSSLLRHDSWAVLFGELVRAEERGGGLATGLECLLCGVHVSNERVVDESGWAERRWVYACMGKVHSLHVRAGVPAEQAVSVCGGL